MLTWAVAAPLVATALTACLALLLRAREDGPEPYATDDAERGEEEP